MKYGMRERVSGAVILLALGVIFIPMLFDEPPARDPRPEPALSIEQPVEVEQAPVAEPAPPSSLGQIQSPQAGGEPAPAPSTAADNDKASPASTGGESDAGAGSGDKPDPIAELARNAQVHQQPAAGEPAAEPEKREPAPRAGEWAVQVGSFGEPGNAERLEKKLDAQGFNAYRRPRDNNLTSVYVGPFATSEAGEKARTELKEKVNLQGLLIRIQEDE
ncbi:MAG: DedD protein [Halomonadaceae bacterium T82-2]|nr:MAG: DedD protein [Halomonadaceae bacterium T82-2]